MRWRDGVLTRWELIETPSAWLAYLEDQGHRAGLNRSEVIWQYTIAGFLWNVEHLGANPEDAGAYLTMLSSIDTDTWRKFGLSEEASGAIIETAYKLYIQGLRADRERNPEG